MHITCPHCQNPIEIVAEQPAEVVCPSCGSSIMLDPGKTRTFLPTNAPRRIGKYELLEQIGMGGYGTVCKARDTELDRIVAIKIPRAGNLSTAQDTDRFLREARSAAQLRHPGIVSLFDAGQSDGTTYLVSEFVHGATLSDHLGAGRLAFHKAAELVAEVADALHFAHEHSVVHRDIKPSNIMIDLDGRPHVMDFGLAKRDVGEITVTLDGQVLGTPAYMSPEQARGEAHRVDARSDVYSLGVILYELLTGELPFRGNSRMLIVQVLRDEPRPPRRINDRIPRDLETICLKAMAKSPARRYATARALAEDLRRWTRGEPIQARPVGRAERLWRWCRRNPAVAGLMAAAGSLLLAVAGVSSIAYFQEAAARSRERELRAEVQHERDAAESARANAIVQRNAARQNLYVAHVVLAQQAWEASDLDRVQKLLDQHLPTDDQPDLRAWEWHYLRSLCHRHSLALEGHKGEVNDLAWSPDSRRLGTAGDDQRIGIWDIATGRALILKQAASGRVVSVAWNTKQDLIASSSIDGSIQLFNSATGELVRTLGGHTDSVVVVWSPDGQRLASAGQDGTVRLWDQEWKALTLPQPNKVRAASWSADSQRIALAVEREKVQIVNAGTGEPVSTLPEADDATSLAWSPDGEKIVTVHGPSNIMVWNAAEAKRLFSLRAQNDNPSIPSTLKVAWSPDSRHISLARATIGSGGGVAVLDVTTQRQTHHFRTGGVFRAAWSPDGKWIATAGKNGVVKLWDPTRDQEFSEFFSDRKTHEHVAWSPDGQRLATAGWWLGPEPFTVWKCDKNSGQLRAVYSAQAAATALAWAPDGKLIALGTGNQITLLNPDSPESARQLDAHTAQINAMAWRPSDRPDVLASASHDQLIKIWNAATGEELRQLKGHTDKVLALAWSPDGKRLASTGHDHSIRLWDPDAGTEISAGPGHPGSTVMALAWSPDGKRLASCAAMEVKIWNAETLREQFDLSGHFSLVTGLAWHPHSQRLATCGFDQTVKLWDTESGQLLLTLRTREQFPRSVAWSPDGRRLAAGTFSHVTLWDSPAESEPTRR